MFNQVTAFLTQNNLLDSNQSGFRSGHWTETALLSVVEDLRLARTASKSSLLTLLDLSAAFDTVNHQILLSTLLRKGISGTALQWFDSYLSDRSFKVSWRGEVSKSQHLATGVPQGSVLGPLLFSVYMASLGSVIHKHRFSYHCYADDTQLYLSYHPDDLTIAARISARLADISSWMKDHHLPLNLAKTELLVVSANPSFHHNLTIQLGSSTITPSETARNLGVVIDDKLNFTDHITKPVRSCRFALYNIKKIRPFLWEHATQLLVQALVLSRLDYCNALLAGLPASSIKPLQLIQYNSARLISNELKRTHATLLFINLHWLPIAAQCIQFKALMFAYRTTSGSAPLYLNSLLQTYMPSRSLRSASERRITVPSQSERRITVPSQSERRITVPSQSERRITVPSQSERHITVHPKVNDALLYHPKVNDALLYRPKVNDALLYRPKVNDALLYHPKENDALLYYPKVNDALLYRPKVNDALLYRPKVNDALLYHPKVNDTLLYIPKWTTHYCTSQSERRITVPSQSERRITVPSQSERRITVPSQRGTKSLSQTLTLTVPIWWPAQLNPSSWILLHLQEMAKNTSLPSLFDPVTRALSILILFYLICLLLFKEHKHLTLYQLHTYSLAAFLSCKTNTKLNVSIFYILIF